MPLNSRWRNYWLSTVYASATLTANGNSGITATPGVAGDTTRFPHTFTLVGENIVTDETLDLTVEWYQDLAGTGGPVGVITTFAQLVAATLIQIEPWPGDNTLWGTPVGQSFVPMFPFFKALWTLGGAVKSMNFTMYASYIQLEP